MVFRALSLRLIDDSGQRASSNSSWLTGSLLQSRKKKSSFAFRLRHSTSPTVWAFKSTLGEPKPMACIAGNWEGWSASDKGPSAPSPGGGVSVSLATRRVNVSPPTRLATPKRRTSRASSPRNPSYPSSEINRATSFNCSKASFGLPIR